MNNRLAFVVTEDGATTKTTWETALKPPETMDKSKRYLVVQDEDRFGDQWAVVEWAKRTDIGLDHNEMEWCICIYSVFHPEVSPGKSGPPELHQYADPINIKGWVLELPDI